MMFCKLCGGQIVEKFKNYLVSGDFAVHLNCGDRQSRNKKQKKKLEKLTKAEAKKAAPFIAPKTTRGWRDVK